MTWWIFSKISWLLSRQCFHLLTLRTLDTYVVSFPLPSLFSSPLSSPLTYLEALSSRYLSQIYFFSFTASNWVEGEAYEHESNSWSKSLLILFLLPFAHPPFPSYYADCCFFAYRCGCNARHNGCTSVVFSVLLIFLKNCSLKQRDTIRSIPLGEKSWKRSAAMILVIWLNNSNKNGSNNNKHSHH